LRDPSNRVAFLLYLINLIQEKLTMTDSILFWNAVALEANRVSHSDPAKAEQTGPPLSARALAIVHLAMYDAYAGITGGAGFPRYLNPAPPPPVAPPPLSARDAVAGAAYTTLVALYKTQKDFFDAQLSCFDTSIPSYQFGVKVGEAMLAKRANDMDARDCGYMSSPARGRHRVDPDNPGQGFHAPFFGAQNKGFAISQRWQLDAPPFDNSEYVKALKQVRAEGIVPELMGTLVPDNLFKERRTPEQSVIGVFWAYDGANRLGTPPRFYNQIIRLVAACATNPDTKKMNTEGDNARLFAFVNAAMGDAGILAWEQKYCHDFWRPVVGIREHDHSFGPAARIPKECKGPVDAANKIDEDADPFWLPWGAPSTNTLVKNFTPPFPAYPSGHATFGAAAFHITRLFYGIPKGDRKADDLFKDLAVVSEELNGGNRDNKGTVRPRHVRNFKGGLWDMIIENATSRIYLGVHWVFDAFALKGDKPDLGRNIGGVRLGLDIAEDIFGANGKAPKMTPDGTAEPPIKTPEPNTKEMPTVPIQPGSVKGCANTVAKKEERGSDVVKDRYPSGRSPR
jgi:membrane-associated phospholipid phosphatase